MIYVTGHTNPDSDCICAAIACAAFLNARGCNATSVRQGDLTRETQFILDLTGQKEPELCPPLANKNVWLVDFSDTNQGPPDLANAAILGVIDHKPLGNLTTKGPVEAWIWPVGSTCTILFNLMVQEHFEIDVSMAKLLLAGVVSDTIGLTSPTTTQRDIRACNQLAMLAGLCLSTFIKDLLIIKTSIEGIDPNTLVNRDLKVYPWAGGKIGIGQIQLATFDQVQDIKPQLNAAMLKSSIELDLDLVVLMLSDIRREVTRLVWLGDWEEHLSHHAENGEIVMTKTLSRKQQVWPWLQNILSVSGISNHAANS
ncbi:manganese-dependent inorganic pyrophosphatase [Parasalinivibrio latis]|uniref:manganese-dependent inorganic pyrophosphatase n=1 Tax=Parasalinivibrio latis TaxID=2952610 RepID=UPI0030E527B1